MLCPPKTNGAKLDGSVRYSHLCQYCYDTTPLLSRASAGGRQWVGGCMRALRWEWRRDGRDVVESDSLRRAADVARACRGGQNRKQGILPTRVHYGLPNQAQAALGGRDASPRIGQLGSSADADPPRGIVVAGGKSIAGVLTRRARALRTSPFDKSSSHPIVNTLASLSIQLPAVVPLMSLPSQPRPQSAWATANAHSRTVSDSRTARRPFPCTAAAHPGLRLFAGLLRRRPLSLNRAHGLPVPADPAPVVRSPAPVCASPSELDPPSHSTLALRLRATCLSAFLSLLRRRPAPHRPGGPISPFPGPCASPVAATRCAVSPQPPSQPHGVLGRVPARPIRPTPTSCCAHLRARRCAAAAVELRASESDDSAIDVAHRCRERTLTYDMQI